jgi:hypothetical protein
MRMQDFGGPYPQAYLLDPDSIFTLRQLAAADLTALSYPGSSERACCDMVGLHKAGLRRWRPER